ncbi:Clp R domain-containing protein [Heracleum sosnowskyi]|uniref:Clp R domain-containing protein n=1 Tax=Heracleum sosnowskyi TaxID=360622 RepID=A0AAD8GPR0_9APIA|nr:Clp R domain-containing protein [Heracleum sosnowskyi]
MNPVNFTHKTNEALSGAHELAMNAGHVQFTPLHIAMSLISDPNGIFRQAIANAGCSEEAANSVQRVIRRAQFAQKSRSDTHLAVDQLILGLLEDSQIVDLFKEAGVSAAKIKSEADKLRGKEGKKVESATSDTNFQALKTFGRDIFSNKV